MLSGQEETPKKLLSGQEEFAAPDTAQLPFASSESQRLQNLFKVSTSPSRNLLASSKRSALRALPDMSSDKSYVEQVAVADASRMFDCVELYNRIVQSRRSDSGLHCMKSSAHCETGPHEHRCLLGCRRRVWLVTLPLMCKTKLQR